VLAVAADMSASLTTSMTRWPNVSDQQLRFGWLVLFVVI
jgi:hypothetical protein